MPNTADKWTTRTLLDWIAGAFTGRDLESPRLSAEILIAHVLKTERLRLYMDPDRPASPAERETLRDLVKRALAHEPIQYLTGEGWFFGMPFTCDARALIPRPSSETIVEHLLQHARREDAGPLRRVADVCTGTGCIAVALAKNLPGATLLATDVSQAALDLAASNAERHDVAPRVTFTQGNLLEPLAGETDLDAIVSNPPYIPDHEWSAVEPNVKDHEPHLALRGGADGLDLVRPLFAGVARHLRPGGWAVVEVAASHAHEAAKLATDAGLTDVIILQDHEGLDRVIAGRKP
ncbi:MAG: peptide chain release factor N(5)-glutamine methyltransferase [Planctomycetota bacterium]